MAKKKVEEFIAETTPRRVLDKSENLYNFSCSNKISDYLEYFKGLLETYGSDANVYITTDYDGFVEAEITVYRDETPAEIERRIEKSKKAKEKAVIQRANKKLKDEEKRKKQEAEEINLLKKLQEKYQGYKIEQV